MTVRRVRLGAAPNHYHTRLGEEATGNDDATHRGRAKRGGDSGPSGGRRRSNDTTDPCRDIERHIGRLPAAESDELDRAFGRCLEAANIFRPVTDALRRFGDLCSNPVNRRGASARQQAGRNGCRGKKSFHVHSPRQPRRTDWRDSAARGKYAHRRSTSLASLPCRALPCLAGPSRTPPPRADQCRAMPNFHPTRSEPVFNSALVLA